jgi:hypothetical protein
MSLGPFADDPAPERGGDAVAAALVAALNRWNAGRDGDRLADDLEAIIDLARRTTPAWTVG